MTKTKQGLHKVNIYIPDEMLAALNRFKAKWAKDNMRSPGRSLSPLIQAALLFFMKKYK